MRSPVIITVSCLHPNRAKWVQEKHLSSLVQAHLGSSLCLSFGTSCVSLALNSRCWFSLLMPCALLRYWFFPPRSWNSAPDFEMLQGSISWFFFLLDDLICRNVLNFLRSLFFSGVSSGNITADCHASVFVFPDCVSWNFPSSLCSTPSAFNLLFWSLYCRNYLLALYLYNISCDADVIPKWCLW